MSFFLFKLYLFLLFTRPFDLFAQSLAEYRPMLFLWVLAFVLGLFKVLSSKTFVWNGAYYRVLLAFMASIVASKVASGWAGAAVGAISEFSSTALLVVLVSMNVGDIDKLKSACLTILAAVALTCFMSVYAYHTGSCRKSLFSSNRMARPIWIFRSIDPPSRLWMIPVLTCGVCVARGSSMTPTTSPKPS